MTGDGPIMNRRLLLAGAMASAALGCTGDRTGGAGAIEERADVVIIGAGLAGLNVAGILKSVGLSVLVLEAADRVGGRVETVKAGDTFIDVGASQIGRTYGRTISAALEHGLELVPEDRGLLPFGTFYKGQWIKEGEWPDHPLNRLEGEERAIPPFMLGTRLAAQYNPLEVPEDWLDEAYREYDVDLVTLLRAKGHSDQAIELASAFAPGIGARETSMLRIWQEATRGQRDAQTGGQGGAEKLQPYGFQNRREPDEPLALISNIKGGTARLPIAMAEALGDAVRLNKKVARIEHGLDGASITCTDGSRMKGSYLVLTIPFTMLRGIAIEPGLGAVHQRAIGQMPYANTARAYLQVDEPFWEKDGLPASFATPFEMFWAIDNHRRGGPHRAMIVLTGKDASRLSAMGPKAAAPFLLERLHRMRPAAKGLTRLVAYKDWEADPLQRGCGFSMAPGQVTAFARQMIDPVGRIHFAGEHTRRVEYGMESAMESGERAALEIIERAQV